MKTKPLDANMSSAHANTSSMHERGSRPPAHQGSMGNTDDASPSSSDNTDKADVPSNSDNSAPKDAMSSDPGTDEESNSSQPSHKLLNLHFHSNFALLPYPQLQQKNIQLLLMTMKLRMKMEKLKGLLSVSHAVVGRILVWYPTCL